MYLNPWHLKNLMLESDLAFGFFLSVRLGGGGGGGKMRGGGGGGGEEEGGGGGIN